MADNLVIGIWADTSKLRGDLAIAAGRSPQKIRYDLKGAGFRKKAHAGRIEKQTEGGDDYRYLLNLSCSSCRCCSCARTSSSASRWQLSASRKKVW